MAPLFVLYGSATGNAEHIAKDLASKYPALGTGLFDSVVCAELDQFKRKKCLDVWKDPPSSCSKHGLVVVSSTTGNGDPPENANRFVRHIKRKTTPADQLQHVAYAVLGLGDTNYDQFCGVGKLIDRKLGDIGGTRAMKVGMADEATGLEDTVEPWCEKVFVELERACRGEAEGDGEGDAADPAEEEKKSESPAPVPASAPAPSGAAPTATAADLPQVAAEKKDAAPLPPKEEPSSVGVALVKSLLGLPPSESLPSVSPECLPSLGPSLSSCELVAHNHDHEADETIPQDLDRMTLSTASTTAAHYNLKHPYSSKVLGARYLTATDVGAARKAVEALATVAKEGTDGEEQSPKYGADGLASDPASDSRLEAALGCFDAAFSLSGSGDRSQYDRNGKRVLELTFSLPDDFTLEYSPGDSIGLIVPNSVASVSYVLDLLEKEHSIKRTDKVKVDGDEPVTVDEAVRHRIDLDTPLAARGMAQARRTLCALANFVAESEEEASALRLLCSKTPGGEALYAKYVDAQRITPVDVLRDFPSSRAGATLHNLLAALPGQVPPRYYSVSSSPLAEGGTHQLTVAFSVVDYLTPELDGGKGRRRVGGVATRYLEALCSPLLAGGGGDDAAGTIAAPAVRIFPKPTQEFRLPPSSSLHSPLILIGPGTGVAPFLGFLSHLRALKNKEEEAREEAARAARSAAEGTWRGGFDLDEDEVRVGEGDAGGLIPAADYRSKKKADGSAKAGANAKEGEMEDEEKVPLVELYFGCRHKSHDWLYRPEMEDFVGDGTLSSLRAVFSREGTEMAPGGDGRKLKYVQDAMRYDKSCRRRFVEAVHERRGRVYVCGDGNDMARDVQEAVVDVLAQDALGGDAQKGREYLKEMKEGGRFVLDIWS
uniref:Flavodoxin-like domain-containing protein n=1 Tax=Odontella aurita TaxID=265563 RepID=A0A7S4INS5_9STRA|mmetsp:Transcript_27996/g.82322  ORF Transcript_27996/g.82322 Transcript_27996/m.82322 type:complete len:885 (+) Transcript_27996:286-2940(+)